MHDTHPTYKIRKHDTIRRITATFGVETDIWKGYHNKMCGLVGVIKEEIPPNLKEIFLLPELWGKESTFNQGMTESVYVRKEIVFFNNNMLLSVPANINNRYGVELNFGNNKIHFEIIYRYIQRVSQEEFQLSIDRGQVYVNNVQPKGKLYQMADKMGKVIYPIVINMDREKRITGIANHQEIITRCKKAQQQLSTYYTGEYAERYIRLFEKQYMNSNNLINHLERELFFRLYFLPIQGEYSGFSKSSIYNFPFGDNRNIICQLDINLEPLVTKHGKIVTHISTREENTDLCFQATYLLYPDDHSVFSIIGSLRFEDNNKRKKNVMFEIYHLNPDERVLKRKIGGYNKYFVL